ncbi:outer membrane lipoprotein-sorting protein [Candidatus Poribacteria bacterium]|nr:outer membrane lipoprotein-sorting protein [Candidatus Poribacteria bacterium]
MKTIHLEIIGIICICLVFFIINTATAASVKEIVQGFREKYKETKNFNAEFTETTVIAGQRRVSKGFVNFQKPNLLRKDTRDPNNMDKTIQLIVSDGGTIWAYTPMIKQVTKQELTQNSDMAELMPGFGHSLENIEDNYNIKFVEDKEAEKQEIHAIELKPKLDGGAKASFDYMQVWIRDKDLIPVQFMYEDKKNQMVFVLSFKDIKINQKLDESTFKFDLPDGVQVISVPKRQ